MSVRRLPRELGLVVVCNGLGCSAQFRSGNIMVRKTRAWLGREGWMKGVRRGTGRHDYCPTCAPKEKATIKRLKAEREAAIKARDEKKKQTAIAKAAKAAGRAAKRAAKEARADA